MDHHSKLVKRINPLPPKLLTVALQEIFRHLAASLSEKDIMVDDKILFYLSFADDNVLFSLSTSG